MNKKNDLKNMKAIIKKLKVFIKSRIVYYVFEKLDSVRHVSHLGNL